MMPFVAGAHGKTDHDILSCGPKAKKGDHHEFA
ncbi:MAG: hypothetical protein RJA87_1182 [Pseudomonadota bacterium]|jgi:hypothetical protein